MTNDNELRSLPDDELLRRLGALLQQSRRVEADLVAHIGEVDERKLYAREACSSMFAYCTEILHLSEGEAYLRIAAARASRKYPMLLEMLREGRLHLTGVAKLAPHLTQTNCEEVLNRAARKSKREIEELVAELSPKADVPPSVRKIPPRPERTQSPTSSSSELRPDAVKFEMPSRPPAVPRPAAQPSRPPVVEPLSSARYLVKFTASTTLREKLDRLAALMHPSVPDRDLATIIEVAVTEKLEQLEARRFGVTKAPRTDLENADTSGSSRYIPAAVRRAVWSRDGGRCTYLDRHGRRCSETRGLELHHRNAYARGGDHQLDNLGLLCRAHNGYLADQEYGREKMDRHRRGESRVGEPAPAYFVRPAPHCRIAG